MLQLLTNQIESDQQFIRWTKVLVRESNLKGNGWLIKGTSVAFNNYGHGQPGTVENELMLCVDPDLANGIVKIVRPVTSQKDTGKLTAVARDNEGRHFLLRQGWLHKNWLSPAIRADFASLTGLQPVPVDAGGKKSRRDWYIVADLGAKPQKIIEGTCQFTLACEKARLSARTRTVPIDPQGYRFGLDEQGRTIKVEYPGRSAEVIALQGHVWQALNKIFVGKLKKPSKNGFEVDAILESAKILIEIKTSVAAHYIYEAVGQLKLYPSLIGLNSDLRPVLLVPDRPMLKPTMTTALDAASIKIYTYSIGELGKTLKITFSTEFLERCGLSASTEEFSVQSTA